MSRAKDWTKEVENLFRFQEAGYRDELEYLQVQQGALVRTYFYFFFIQWLNE